MALIVETGVQVSGADSYVSLTDAAAYHTDRGNTAWAAAASDTVREQALRKATQYIDGHYFHRWKGAVVAPLTQSLQWPRAGVKISDPQEYYATLPSFYDVSYSGFLEITTIPQKLKDATCEAALRSLSAALAPDLKRGGRMASVNVAGIQEVFEQGASPNTSYQIIDQLLAPFLKSNQMSLVRG